LSPLLTLIIAYLVLKETLKAPEIVNIIISFGGVLTIIYFSDRTKSDASDENVSLLMYVIAMLISVLSAVIVGILYVVIRKLKNIHYSLINGSYGYLLLIISVSLWIIYRPLMGNIVEYNITGEQWMYIIMIGLFTTGSN
jgi:drug/metabolite transporter (DMT)-like permease